MNIQQLYYVMDLSRTKNFSQTASNLFISQPTLSQQIALLEKELDTKLFIRNTRTVELTNSGELFCNYASKIVDLIDELKDQFTGQTAANYTFNISLCTFYQSLSLEKIIDSYLLENKNVSCNITVLSTSDAINMILKNKLHFAILKASIDVLPDSITYEILHKDPLCVVINKDNLKPNQRIFDVQDLPNYPLITPGSDSFAHQNSQEIYERYNLKFNLSQYNSLDTNLILDLVAANQGIFLSSKSIRSSITNKNIAVIPLSSNDTVYTILISSQDMHVDKMMKKFKDHIIHGFQQQFNK